MSERAVLVSGASTGIGAATVRALAERGIVAFAGVRKEEDAQRIAGENVRPVMLDVTDAASIARALETVKATGAELFGVVSNAGVALGGPLETLPIEQLRHQFEVNVFGALALVQAALPLMHENEGRVVFVGSISGRLATPYIGPYSASKFALRAIADVMRVELGPAGIGVSLIEPGSVKTPIWEKGRERRDELETLVARSGRKHYRVALASLFDTTRSEERAAMRVEVVSDAILHALTDATPRPTYLLGPGVRLRSFLAVLPSRWRDRAMRTAMNLP